MEHLRRWKRADCSIQAVDIDTKVVLLANTCIFHEQKEKEGLTIVNIHAFYVDYWYLG